MNAKNTKKSLQQRVDDLVAGTGKHAPGGTLTLGNASYTAQSLVQVLTSLGDAIAAADAAKASWQQALGKMTDTRAQRNSRGATHDGPGAEDARPLSDLLGAPCCSCDKPLGTLKRDDDAEAQRAAGHAPLAQSPDERTRQY